MLSRFLGAAALLLVLSASLQAQYSPYHRNPYNRQQPAAQQVNIQGTIQAVAPPGVLITDNNGRSWPVATVPGATIIHVKGTATPEFLRAGLAVEFEGEVDSHGLLANKVGQLKIIVLAKEDTGLFPPSADKPDKPDKAGEKADGAAAAAGADPGAAGNTPPAKPPKHSNSAHSSSGKNAASIQPGKYRIAGFLSATRAGKLSVRAGHHSVQLDMADNPKISVDFADVSVARKGDKASVKGMLVRNRLGAIVEAQELKIDLAEPLTGPKKKSAIKSDAKSTRPPKKDEGLPASE